MSAEQFARDVVAGRIKCGTSQVTRGKLYSKQTALSIDAELDDIVAEAFNQDVFPAGRNWEDARQIMKAALYEAVQAKR